MIGERLEEARKRKGVSIREAAESTKIRGDFLLSMEDNSFDIQLPQIYVRGFLKNYARYLQLDPNKILTDYDAHLLGRTPKPHDISSSRSNRESLGHVEIPDEKEAEDEEAPAGVIVSEPPEEEEEPELRFNIAQKQTPQATPPPPTLEGKGTHYDQETWNENKTLYMKIGLVFAGILLVSIILIVLIQLLSSDTTTPEINPEVADRTPAAEVSQPELSGPAEAAQDTIVISASDNVTLIVEQTMDGQRLYSGALNAGETLSLDKEGPVSIRFTNGSAIVIEKNGQQFRPGQSGVGRTTVD